MGLGVPITKVDREAILEDIEEKNKVIRNLADEFETVLVPLRRMRDEAVGTMSQADGIHPDRSQHSFQARLWLEAVGIKAI